MLVVASLQPPLQPPARVRLPVVQDQSRGSPERGCLVPIKGRLVFPSEFSFPSGGIPVSRETSPGGAVLLGGGAMRPTGNHFSHPSNVICVVLGQCFSLTLLFQDSLSVVLFVKR